MSLRVIASDADLAEGAAHLALVCPVWAQVLPGLGPLPLRRREDGFSALMSAIVSQQISTAAAASISGRLAAAGLDRPETIMAAEDAALRACGLSGQKVRYLRALAGAGIDFDALRLMPDEEVSATLTALPGIGRWTAEIYLKFALGRADAFAAFAETGDIFDHATARRLEETILSRGGSAPADQLWMAFRGRMPGVDALLKGRGLD